MNDARSEHLKIIRLYVVAFGIIPALLIVAVFIRYLVTWRGPLDWGWQSPSQIEQIATPIIDGLEAYKAKHGRYPESLGDAGLWSFTTSYGRLRYSCMPGGTAFKLDFGDLRIDGQAVMYDSVAARWSIVASGGTS